VCILARDVCKNSLPELGTAKIGPPAQGGIWRQRNAPLSAILSRTNIGQMHCRQGITIWSAGASGVRPRERDPRKLIPPLHGALLKNEQDVHLFERLAFLSRREV